LTTAAAALAVVPLIVLFMRNHPADMGLTAYGATPEDPGPPPHQPAGSSATRALRVLRDATRVPAFWLLVGGFAICGATTNGLIATHFIPAAMDHGMPPTTAASLLALVGLFDVGGTIASGWFTDRVDPRFLLLTYYTLRGVGLAVLPSLLAPHTTPGTWVFVIFYGLDWVATVPPTVMLCREWFGPEVGSIVFGWVFASHQIGASAMAFGAGVIRDHTDSYNPAFYTGAVLCAVAAVLSISIRRRQAGPPSTGAGVRRLTSHTPSTTSAAPTMREA
jgi:predicted MFS family arabinose efflux permease